ncbi:MULTISPECIES: XisH protein [Pseudanabaena]|uniref:XisH protein n=2 Tax=Pseudanabaena TaxID=1152 RepID=L8MU92_9CYAN|nr:MULTISPECIES: XisH protein [Pseudanabaena]ELS30334.1 XisH protein [Pseudanabaena biceps PCC 7429]MDG3497391.1 element excision factor XisH family protein [Pseudanabaena catenata USMAC16]
MAKDLFHNEVRIALEKDGWLITHDPYRLRYGVADIYIDLAAEEAPTTMKPSASILILLKLTTIAGILTKI